MNPVLAAPLCEDALRSVSRNTPSSVKHPRPIVRVYVGGKIKKSNDGTYETIQRRTKTNEPQITHPASR